MSSTTPSTQTGARANTALLPTLGLGGNARAGNGSEGGGAAFSELLRDKITAPKPEAPKAASPAPAPATPTAQAVPAQPAKARKAESRQNGGDRAAEGNTASTEADGETAATQDAGSAETRTDARSRRTAKAATGQALKPGSEAAQAQQQPGEPVTVYCAADDTAAIPTTDAGEEALAEDSIDADASVAQAILQMINAPASAPLKAAAIAGGTDKKAAEAAPDAPLQSLLPADGSAIAASAAKSATAQGQAAAAATAAAAGQLKLGEAIDGQAQMAGEAQLARAAEALAAPNAQTPGGAPGSFAAHLQALSNPRSAQAAGSSAASAVALAQPLHSPEFAPALSARLALLAAEGVQQAQLQLNPAEMGPVSVQITVDGQQAQIAFHAVQAETRQVLEQSLPELAAALRDQGLTLSGGGVFEQSQQQAREQAQQAASGGSHGLDRSGLPNDAELLGAEANTGRIQAPRSRGVLDLYA